MNDLTTESGVKNHMSAATSEKDWNNRCDEVKRANGNDYPPFWWSAIIVSGLHTETRAKW